MKQRTPSVKQWFYLVCLNFLFQFLDHLLRSTLNTEVNHARLALVLRNFGARLEALQQEGLVVATGLRDRVGRLQHGWYGAHTWRGVTPPPPPLAKCGSRNEKRRSVGCERQDSAIR